MNHLSRKILNAVYISSSLLLLSLPLRAQSPDSTSWGEAVEGVQMSISAAGYVKPGVPKLRVTFRNNRSEDVDLYLGIIGGSSPRPCDLEGRRIPCTFSFTLDLTDHKGVTRKLEFKGISFVAGRLDPYVVSLRAGSAYSLELGLDQFWSPATHEYNFKPAPGRYQISLEFDGLGSTSVFNRRPLEKMNLWRGKLRSNILAIRV